MSLAIDLTTATYARDEDGDRYLAFVLGDRPDRLYASVQKPALEAAGLLFALQEGGGGFEDLLPPVAFTPPGEAQEHALRGFVRDPALLALYRRYRAAVAAGTFAVGPAR